LKTIEEVFENWEVDCKIPSINFDETSRNTPVLHSKYLSALSHAKLRLKQAEMQQKTLLMKKWKYYNGKMTKDEIDREGWDYDPLEGLKVMKGDMDYYYDSDKEIQESELKIEYLKTMINTLTEIVDALKWRHQTIGNIIRWKVFESGG
jgi:hypothetical protein